MVSGDKRIDIYEVVKRELIGPSNIEVDKNGEEILSGDSPNKRYVSGMLFPQRDNHQGDADDGSNNDDDEGLDDCIDLSNAYKQSAMSLSVMAKSGDEILLHVNFAYYDTQSPDSTVAKYGKSFRHSDQKDLGPFKYEDLLKLEKNGGSNCQIVKGNVSKKELTIYAFFTRRFSDGQILVTFSLVNENVSNAKSSAIGVFFQVEMSAENKNGFAPIPHSFHDAPWLEGEEKEEQEENNLIYRGTKEYAIGHGCSPVWDDVNGAPKKITGTFLPAYEIKAIVQGPENHPDFSMKSFADDIDGSRFTFKTIEELCSGYDSWIESQDAEISKLPAEFRHAAESNLQKCKECSARIRKGLSILESNPMALEAFRLANQAMLLQQLHSRLPLRKWVHKKGDYQDSLENEDSPFLYPDIQNPATWSGGLAGNGHWYAFQLAFVLICLDSIVNKASDERKNVELIWFPTGGGKTEAYLGLSAFVIFFGRLSGTDDGTCCKIIMRYTLRLLTSQQYERAASLICACEYIRAHYSIHSLGSAPISIGLWVGSSATPNNNADAIRQLNNMANATQSSPFVIEKCPWCGAEMGHCENASERKKGEKLNHAVHGYREAGMHTDHHMVVCQCDNPKCEFHNRPLPLQVVDEEIYKNPPTLLIGVVDKFAQIPFNTKIRNLFGLKNGPVKNRQHPELIIQDELHLISGPLGSVVGAYEFAIDTLSSYEDGGVMIHPKVIASTATISLAKEQCKSIFNVPPECVKVFPQTCLNAGESYFSFVDKKRNGRFYVGICGGTDSSTDTVAIRLLSTLVQCHKTVDFSKNPKQNDAYWTNVCYFNSLRELGQAKTWVSADIKEYLDISWGRRGIENPQAIPNSLELTSRIGSESLKSSFDKLNISVLDNDPGLIYDICLATNMISVGVDVKRLGLMTVFGQPKTVSEYIQATSRIGRDPDNRPGLIFILFTPNKPRDKSIFEDFQLFNSKFYSYVEPTSVSVFSPQLRQRALPAVLLGTLQALWCDDNNGDPVQIVSGPGFDVVENMLLDRVSRVDNEELPATKAQIDSIKKNIVTNQIHNFVSSSKQVHSLGAPIGLGVSALYPDGTTPSEACRSLAYSAPQTMRSVDLECGFSIQGLVKTEE